MHAHALAFHQCQRKHDNLLPYITENGTGMTKATNFALRELINFNQVLSKAISFPTSPNLFSISLECPPPPKVKSTYTPFFLIHTSLPTWPQEQNLKQIAD